MACQSGDPSAAKCSNWPFPQIASQHEPSLGSTETEEGGAGGIPSQSCEPSEARWCTWARSVSGCLSTTQHEPSVQLADTR